MKIITWNVNGIRAATKKGLMDFVQSEQADILCLQETKANRDQVEAPIDTLQYPFAEWHSAERKGYSGVATFSKAPVKHFNAGIGTLDYDREGRVLITEHEKFLLYNIYFPNGGSGEDRHNFKQKFLKDLNAHIQKLLKAKKPVIVVGDYNVAPTEIDVHDPKRLAKESGFLPEEREWFSDFLNLGMVDTFRHFHPEAKNRYSWWSYRELARISNRGWRIDHICVSKDLLPYLKKAEILDSVEGSDHCPVSLEIF